MTRQIDASRAHGLEAQRVDSARVACAELIALYMCMVDAISDLAANAAEVRSDLLAGIDGDELAADKSLVVEAVARYKSLQVDWTAKTFQIEFLGGDLSAITDVLRALFGAKEALSQDYLSLFQEVAGDAADPSRTMDEYRPQLSSGQQRLQEYCKTWIAGMER